MLNKSIAIATLIVARCCRDGACCLTDTQIKAFCDSEGVAYDSVKEFINMAHDNEAGNNTKELMFDAILCTSIAKSKDIDDEAIKEVTAYYIKFMGAVATLKERYKNEYAEEVTRLESKLNQLQL